MRDNIRRLAEQGIRCGAGVSAHYWTPDTETLPEGMRVEAAVAKHAFGDVYHIDGDSEDGKRHLTAKAVRQLAYGFDAIEYDEFFDSRASADEVMRAVREQAQSLYGKRVFLSTNASYGGQDFQMLAADNDGTEEVDYYVRNYPYRLQGQENDPGSFAPFDGTFNLIPQLREAHRRTVPKPFYYFVDFGGELFWAPHDFGVWLQFLRIANAQILASGGFPGQGRSFYNNLDSLERGVFTLVANMAKFLREHQQLWSGLTWIEPGGLMVSRDRIFTSAFQQPERTILHLVNGRYDNARHAMEPAAGVRVTLPLGEAPASV